MENSKKAGPLWLFWREWKVRNRIVFKDEIFSTQKVKISFVFLLWSKTEKCLYQIVLQL